MYSGMTNWLHKHYFDFMASADSGSRPRWRYGHRIVRVPVPGQVELNIDFVGGTAYGGVLTKPLNDRGICSPKRSQDVNLKVERVERKDESWLSVRCDVCGRHDFDGPPADGRGRCHGHRAAKRCQRAGQPIAGLVGRADFHHRPKRIPAVENSSRRFNDSLDGKGSRPGSISGQLAFARTARRRFWSKMTFELRPQNRHATLAFNHPASPGYLKLLLDRAFEAAGVKDNQPFELRGEGKGDEGRYSTMALDVSSRSRMRPN